MSNNKIKPHPQYPIQVLEGLFEQSLINYMNKIQEKYNLQGKIIHLNYDENNNNEAVEQEIGINKVTRYNTFLPVILSVPVNMIFKSTFRESEFPIALMNMNNNPNFSFYSNPVMLSKNKWYELIHILDYVVEQWVYNSLLKKVVPHYFVESSLFDPTSEKVSEEIYKKMSDKDFKLKSYPIYLNDYIPAYLTLINKVFSGRVNNNKADLDLDLLTPSIYTLDKMFDDGYQTEKTLDIKKTDYIPLEGFEKPKTPSDVRYKIYTNKNKSNLI